MEPMNVFLTTHRQQFKTFVDDICDISSDRASSSIPPSYATPITILGRLPGTSREGFPSLPYLIDQARECMSLVDLWLDTVHEIEDSNEWSKELQRFDKLCEEAREKARQCLTRAEQAERPSGSLEPKWEELVEQMQKKSRLREASGRNSPLTPGSSNRNDVNSSTSSLAESYFHRRTAPSSGMSAHRFSPGMSHFNSTTSPQSPLSPDEATSEELDSESSNTPPGSSSGVWDPGQSPSIDAQPGSDIEDSDVGMENSSDVIGSSIYSLTPMKSNRDSAATTKAVAATIANDSNAGSRKSSRSQYSLRHTSERGANLSRTAQRSVSAKKPSSRDGEPGQQPVRSLYRLHATEDSPGAGDSSASLGRRSPSSKDARPGLRDGVFGGVFRKKTKERDKDDTWKGGGVSS